MIFIVDFGSQVTQLIARRIREAGVYCEIVSSKSLYRQLLNRGCSGIVFSGGPASVHKSNTPKIDKRIFKLNIPILGICYGMQLLCYQLGGKVKISKKREFGKTLIKPSKKSVLFSGFGKRMSLNYVWMSLVIRLLVYQEILKALHQVQILSLQQLKIKNNLITVYNFILK